MFVGAGAYLRNVGTIRTKALADGSRGLPNPHGPRFPVLHKAADSLRREGGQDRRLCYFNIAESERLHVLPRSRYLDSNFEGYS